MGTMNVSLPETMIDFVDDMVAGGSYASSSEVVGEALQLLQRQRTAVLCHAVAEGLAAAAAGRFSDRSVRDIADGVLGEASSR